MDTLEFLYGTLPGRVLLKPLTARPVSLAAGAFLDSGLSRPLVKPFIRRSGIQTEDYLPDPGHSFNDYFCRRIRPEMRPIDSSPDSLIAPCDGLLTVYPIEKGLIVPVKQSRYAVADLLRSRAIAAHYDGGWCLVFRLRVDHYHRYVYAETGLKSPTYRIPGVYHTVQPVALRREPVFCENTREYTFLRTAAFGTLTQMEVGAMLVGRIANLEQGSTQVLRGQEKGCFQYGGSTVILLVEPGKLVPRADLSALWETPVRMGEAVGRRAGTE